jgi:Domain of unknown function (DUF5710)
MRLYLNVPFSEKDDAKQLGARWDASVKKWYVADHLTSSSFSRWTESHQQLNQILIAPIWILSALEQCYNCTKISHVNCLASTSIKDIEYDDYNQAYHLLVNIKDEQLTISNLETFDSRLLQPIKQYAPNYFLDYSKTQGAEVWMNHCEYCGTKLGDFFLHNEPSGAFFPMSKDKSTISRFLIFNDGEFTFSGGYGCKPIF